MPFVSRLVGLILLALVAAAPVAQSAAATEMAVSMAAADADPIGMDMPGCSGGDTDGATDTAPCDLACTAPLLADVSGAAMQGLRARPQHAPSDLADLRGRTGGPALDPPRPVI